MNMIWILEICIGISWAGCGSWPKYEYPNESACYRALESIRNNNKPTAVESGARRDMTALCRPKTAKDTK
jgi:hypothetical protein